MRIFLLQDVKGLGRKSDVKEVSEGYARNFLIPQKKAVAADQGVLKQKEELVKEEALHLQKIKETAEKLKSIRLEFKVKTGEGGKAFGRVTAKEIKNALEGKGFKVLEIETPGIKTTGEAVVSVKLEKGITSSVKVIVQGER